MRRLIFKEGQGVFLYAARQTEGIVVPVVQGAVAELFGKVRQFGPSVLMHRKPIVVLWDSLQSEPCNAYCARQKARCQVVTTVNARFCKIRSLVGIGFMR